MKAIAFCLLAFITLPALADGNCVSHPDKGVHEDFCNNLTRQTCGAHSSLCTWEAGKAKFLKITGKDINQRVKVIEVADHHCTTRDGMEAHESFCSNQSKATCSAHSMCRWE